MNERIINERITIKEEGKYSENKYRKERHTVTERKKMYLK
jgi:hypothetical protein